MSCDTLVGCHGSDLAVLLLDGSGTAGLALAAPQMQDRDGGAVRMPRFISSSPSVSTSLAGAAPSRGCRRAQTLGRSTISYTFTFRVGDHLLGSSGRLLD